MLKIFLKDSDIYSVIKDNICLKHSPAVGKYKMNSRLPPWNQLVAARQQSSPL